MASLFDIRNSPGSQVFVGVGDIRDGMVILKNGGFRAILMCSSVNFALKSQEEQDSLIYRFQNFLNSMDFPIQITVNSRQLNLDHYLQELGERAIKQQNELLKVQTQEYVEFVKNLIQFSNIISKYFYVVIPFEPKTGSAAKGAFGGSLRFSKQQLEEFKTHLWQRLKHVKIGLEAMEVRAEPLNTAELVELFYNLYNPDDKMKQSSLSVYELSGREDAKASE